MSNKNQEFFSQRPVSKPIIYAYSDPTYPGMLKVGYKTRTFRRRKRNQIYAKTDSGKTD